MEPKFKTSFIPKQSIPKDGGAPSVQRQVRPNPSGSIVFFIGLIVMIVTVGSAAGVFLWKQFLETSISEKAATLERARDAFQPRLIQDLERLDRRITAAETLLDQHLAPSALFDLLANTTLTSVQFNSLSLNLAGDNGSPITLEMDGNALDFDSVALQSDVFGSNRFITDPIISGLDVAGDLVSFNVSAEIGDRFLEYSLQVTGDEDTRIVPINSTQEIVPAPIEEEVVPLLEENATEQTTAGAGTRPGGTNQ